MSTVEHWFQACKATSRRAFDNILACGSAAAAKHAGRDSHHAVAACPALPAFPCSCRS